MPIPSHARRFIDECWNSGRDVIGTFQPPPSKIDHSDIPYYYWEDGSGVVIDGDASSRDSYYILDPDQSSSPDGFVKP